MDRGPDSRVSPGFGEVQIQILPFVHVNFAPDGAVLCGVIHLDVMAREPLHVAHHLGNRPNGEDTAALSLLRSLTWFEFILRRACRSRELFFVLRFISILSLKRVQQANYRLLMPGLGCNPAPAALRTGQGFVLTSKGFHPDHRFLYADFSSTC